MAKGKTNQPLTFMFPYPSNQYKELTDKLVEQGHEVIFNLDMSEVDIVFGPNCHMLTPDMLEQKGIIDLALKAARKRKKNK